MLHIINKLFPFAKKISLAVIFLEYDRPNLGGAESVFNTLQTYLSKISKCDITYLRVDNKDENKGLTKISRNLFAIGGDNQYREFSGWQKGVDHLDELGGNFDLILFVNDMFMAPGESFLKDYAKIELLQKSIAENLIIGRIDSTGQKYSAYDYDVSEWICTNCFFAPSKALYSIGNLVSVKDNLNDFLPFQYPLSGNAVPKDQLAPVLFKKDAPINETYKLWLVEWLTERWHSKFEINEHTWELFRVKVRNILNESILTARLKKAGFHPQVYGEKRYY